MENQHLFFSIIIPAHNEEKYIEATLRHLTELNYPKDKYTVLTIENGSTDKTFEKARAFAGNNIEVISSPKKGVSAARNLGISMIKAGSDWTVFLDADTVLKSDFLNDLNIFLQNNNSKNYVAGTTSLEPDPFSNRAKLWFAFYDLCHRLFKVSYSIQIVKSSILGNIKFDEQLSAGEDLKFLKQALKFGKFVFFQTKTVLTSTRRFERVGWWRLFFQWIVVANLPHFLQKKSDYKIIR